MTRAKMGHDKVKVTGTKADALVHQAATNPIRRLVPLGGGSHVYYYDPIHIQTHHLKVPSTEFVDAVRPACELGLGSRIRQELEEFDAAYPKDGWKLVLDSLVEEGVVE
jgi:hypothetical protein